MHEEQYKEIIGKLPIGYARNKIIVDEQGVLTDIIFVETNPAFLKISGLIIDNLAGKRVSDYIPDFSLVAEKYGSFICQAAAGSSPIDFDYFSLLQKRWLRVTAFCLDPGYLDTLITDVTREKNNTPQEMESQLLRGFMDAAKDGAFVKDAQGKYILSNKALENMFHAASAEIWGRDDNAFMPEDAAVACRDSDRVAVTEQKLVVTEEIIGEKTFETSKFPVHLPNGEIGVGGIIRDVTQTKEQEELLSLAQKQILDEKDRSIAQMEAMVKGHGAVMFIIDPGTGKILDTNPAATDFYGFSREELLSMGMNEINTLPPEELKSYRLQAVDKEQRYFTFPHRLKCGEIR